MITWEKTPEDAFSELAEAYATAIHRGVYDICQKWAPLIANEMKQTAPWTDRTGNLRQALYTEVNQVVNQMVELILSHGLDYGLFLEVKNSGRFAVISPTLDRFAVKVWADVVHLLRH